MINLDVAKQIVLKNLAPGTEIKSVVERDNEFLFIAVGPDPLEGRFDPFVKVNKVSGAFIDFSPQDYDNPRELLDSLRKASIS